MLCAVIAYQVQVNVDHAGLATNYRISTFSSCRLFDRLIDACHLYKVILVKRYGQCYPYYLCSAKVFDSDILLPFLCLNFCTILILQRAQKEGNEMHTLIFKKKT